MKLIGIKKYYARPNILKILFQNKYYFYKKNSLKIKYKKILKKSFIKKKLQNS